MVAEREPTRAELYRIIERLREELAAAQVVVARQSARIEELEAEVAAWRGTGGAGGSGGQRPVRPPRPPRKTGPRHRRAHAFVRPRGIATQQVTHAVDRCPDCGCALRGGSVKRHREVIEIALAPATITDHRLVERVCPLCQKRCVPRLGPGDGVVGQHRFGPRLLALIVTLHQVGRMTVRPIQEHLATVFGVHVSLGAIEDALRTVASRGAAEVAAIRAQIRASPAAHADETSWPEDGTWRTLWVVSARRFRYFEIGRRTAQQIDAILGATYAGILVTDFYAAYHHFGLHQPASGGLGPHPARAPRPARDLPGGSRARPLGPTPSPHLPGRPRCPGVPDRRSAPAAPPSARTTPSGGLPPLRHP